MDLRQIEYILEIAKENNITKAARNLYLSQSALNQQLLKLEKELGTQLFYRSRTDWRPTEAGLIYLQGARDILKIKRDVYNHIADISHSQQSELRIGLTTNRGIKMFTAIYPALRRKFPKLSISPLEMSAREIQRAIQDGEIDVGFLVLADHQRTNACYVEIGREEMVVTVPRSHPAAQQLAAPGEALASIDLRVLADEPFVLMYRQSLIRPICDEVFQDAGVKPKILIETSNTSSIPEMVRTNLCCGILPRCYANENDPEYGCFVLKSHPTRTLCISYRTGSYLTDAAKEFIVLARQYWHEHLPPIQNN